jgi:hypothetical protein
MNSRADLDAFLQTEPRDAGCGEAMDLLHVYAEIVVADPGGADLWCPQVAAHVRACGACAEDLAGLLAAIRAELSDQ